MKPKSSGASRFPLIPGNPFERAKASRQARARILLDLQRLPVAHCLMRIVRHPLVDQDLAALVDHIVDVTGGDFDAAGRRLDEVDDLIADISANPMSAFAWRHRWTDGWSVMVDAAIV